MPFSPVSFSQPSGTPIASSAQFVSLPTTTPLRIVPRMTVVQSAGTPVTPSMTPVSGVTPSLATIGPVPVQTSTITPVTTVAQAQSITPLPAAPVVPVKTSLPVPSVTTVAPSSPPTHTVMNLKPNSRSRRSSITERSTQITTERLSELVSV